MAVDSSILVLPYSISSGALESPSLLPPSSIIPITISSHITIILIITHLSTSLHLYISTSQGALFKLIEGHDLSNDATDGMVNMVTLVNALILTIPPGIMTGTLML